jgi:integrase
VIKSLIRAHFGSPCGVVFFVAHPRETPEISGFTLDNSGHREYIPGQVQSIIVRTWIGHGEKMAHLTDAAVRRLPLPAKGNRVTYDDDVPGFGCRVTAGGARSFVLNYVTRGGRERRITIGGCSDDWSTTEARREAKRLRHLIDQGGDPLADIEDERAAPTVTDLIERFKAEHLPKRRASTVDAYTRMLDKHIGPHFGPHIKVADVRFEDIDALHRRLTRNGSPYMANRCVAVLSKMFSMAERWRMRTDNPARGIEKNSEAKRKRYLSGDELSRLVTALAGYSDQQIANAFRLLLLTGARRGEVLAMEWGALDLGAGIWTKAGSTTKQKTDHVVPLSAPARQLLSEIRDQYIRLHPKKPLPQYVFPGSGESGHVVEIKKGWAAICKRAGITKLRIHDLRHSFASQLISGGAPLALIGSLLGHSNPTTTHRYAHMFDDPQRKAVESVGAVVTAAGKPPVAEAVPLKRR